MTGWRGCGARQTGYYLFLLEPPLLGDADSGTVVAGADAQELRMRSILEQGPTRHPR